jgi:hypothetical protein
MRALVALCCFFAFSAMVVAQVARGGAAEIREVSVGTSGDTVTIDVSLTEAVIPDVIIATGPDRLVLQLPNTAAPKKQQGVSVNQNGVRGVRVGLNQVAPPIARVVVDLKTAHPYAIAMKGNKITLTVLPVPAADRPSEMHGATSSDGSTVAQLSHRQPNRGLSWSSSGGSSAPAPRPPGKSLRTAFMIKYVAEGAAYLNGGRSSGLAPGMKLAVRDPAARSTGDAGGRDLLIAELHIISVAQNSAVTEIRPVKRAVKIGDWAFLSSEDVARIQADRSSKASAKRTVGSAFMADNSTASHVPAAGSNSLSPEDVRLRARIGLDYSGIRGSGTTPGSSSQRGMNIRADMTNIAGTHWNLQGYWRGRLTSSSEALENTMQDYLDKTYTLQLFYDNPESKWLGGIGRLYLPWAVSLDTIDGGYLGRRVGRGVIAGVFAGTTPNPASWHYNPDGRIAGSFVNFEGGSYDALHYTSTTGIALSTVRWKLDRPYLFLENALSYSKYLSVYHSFIVDDPQGLTTDGIRPGAGISRSYLTVHVQPYSRIAFDIYHNYFRDVPTAATQLVGTGLVDKLLYQGLNVGVRVEPVRHFFVYTTLGRSDSTGDARRSLNQMYGFTWSEIGHSGFRADVHYSKFDSSFARGDYRVLSLSRHLGNRMIWDTQLGQQSLLSAFTANNRSFFLDTSFDTNLSTHSYIQSGYTIERGAQLNYDQWYVSLGYRFDLRGPNAFTHGVPGGPAPQR